MTSKETLWEFSNRIYAIDTVSNACLSLQDKCGADVNMVLYCCWLAEYQGKFTDDQLSASLAFSYTWTNNVVHPLRRVRRWLKKGGDRASDGKVDTGETLRLKLKSIELESEKHQLSKLASLAALTFSEQDKASQMKSASSNLRRYCQQGNIELTPESIQFLSVILSAIQPSIALETCIETMTK